MDVGRADEVQAFGIGGGLGKAAGEGLHGRLDQLADFEVAALGFFREACVGQKEGNACFFATLHQVGHGIGIRLPETLVPMLEIGWGFEGAAAQVAADQEGGEVPQRGVKAAYHAYGSCVGIGLFYRKLKRKI
ncbi:Uncharacterised protein [Mycobacteroides abscessus subsp. massiliense]|nr:Uncharacterised protein [Mycobacteroides abscessus subsp. massiliense]